MSNQDNDKVFQKSNINWYPGHMAKTKRLISEKINLIDIVLEVIDARIPYSSKIIDIDNYIKAKPRIMIMTKYDLCDKKETKKWISYYENMGYKVIPIDLIESFSSKEIFKVIDDLLEQKNKKREDKGLSKKRIRALVVGIPNVGKSTLINRLVGKKAVVVGNKPGITKNLDWIRINDKIELLDTPGILWPKFEQEVVAYNLASLTAIKEEVLPISKVACYILKMLYKYYPGILNERYKLTSLTEDFIDEFEQIGKMRGCLIKGGEVDYDKVANVILNDIKEGYIKNITFDRRDMYE